MENWDLVFNEKYEMAPLESYESRAILELAVPDLAVRSMSKPAFVTRRLKLAGLTGNHWNDRPKISFFFQLYFPGETACATEARTMLRSRRGTSLQ